MSHTLTVITPSFNDFEAFQTTIASLKAELQEGDQLIVVDSSHDANAVPKYLSDSRLACRWEVVWVSPSGVYAAQNLGIRKAKGAWLQILNSGDLMCQGGRLAIENAIQEHPLAHIHVFRQEMVRGQDDGFLFYPDPRGIWSHQSVILARNLHDQYGLYDERYRIAADQIFLAQIRRSEPFALHPFVLTRYDLRGLSASVNWTNSKEIYAIWRTLGRAPAICCLKAFVLPRVRAVLEVVLGPSGTDRIKSLLFRKYSRKN